MTLPPIHLGFSRGDCPELEALLAERVSSSIRGRPGTLTASRSAPLRQDDSGKVVGGITGYTWGGCCSCPTYGCRRHRGNSGGIPCCEQPKRTPKDKGCTIAFVSSRAFATPGFHAHLGYEQQASISDHPVGHLSVLLAKRLAQVADQRHAQEEGNGKGGPTAPSGQDQGHRGRCQAVALADRPGACQDSQSGCD